MSVPLPPNPARDAAIRAMLPLVPALGWTAAALRAGGPGAAALFPGGAPEMVEAYIDLADRDMAAAVPAELAGLGRRVRAAILARLDQAEPDREAVARALAVMALPGGADLAARSLSRTVEAIWTVAGDRSADFSWYTKRASLAAVYATTLLFWLRPGTGREEAALFLDRRLAGLARIGRLRARLTAGFRPGPASS